MKNRGAFMERRFEFEKETKNTVRFNEIDDGDGIMVGNLYVQKNTLDEIGWKNENDVLVVNIEVE